MIDLCIEKNKLIKFEADNLIYNRFDIIYQKNIEHFLYEYGNRIYAIDAYYENFMAKMNIWGKEIPTDVFENAVADIFKHHSDIYCIEIKQARNNYHNLLEGGNDIRIPLPETVDQLLQRVRAKHRTAIKRIKKLLEKEYGRLNVIKYKSDIPDEIVLLYFKWKQITYGKDYNMTPEEYLERYHVTDAMLLKAGGNEVAILFFCQIDNVVYLENFSYNLKMEQFSPGYLIYEMFLEELIYRNCSLLYLGGGNYTYKKRFGAEESVAYSGMIYRKEVFEALNRFFNSNNIKRIAIYGLGVVGRSFLRVADHLAVNVIYGIDSVIKKIDKIPVYAPAEQLEDVDAVIITLKAIDKEVKVFLNSTFNKVYSWKDILEGILYNSLGKHQIQSGEKEQF